MRRLLALGSTLALLIGCVSSRDVSWRIHLNGTRTNAAVVQLVVRRGECTSGPIEHVASIAATMPGGAAHALPPLPAGPHCFEATVVDGSCRIIGEGHTQLTLPTSGADVVTEIVVDEVPFVLCDSSACSQGECAVDAGTSPDGSMDGAMDAPPIDAPDTAVDAFVDAFVVPIDAGHDAGVDAGPPPETQVFECESGMLMGSDIMVLPDTTASGTHYVAVPSAPGTTYPFTYADHLGTPPPNMISIPIVLPHGGQWQLIVSYLGETSASTQLYAGFGSEPDDLRGFGRQTGAYEWAGGVQLHFGDLFALPSGPNQILVVPAQVGARCDRIVVTSVAGLDAGAP